LADHDGRGKFPEASRVTEDQEDPLMPEGDDSLTAPTKVIEDLLFMEETDPNRHKVETEYPVGDLNQTVADGKGGEFFDHGRYGWLRIHRQMP